MGTDAAFLRSIEADLADPAPMLIFATSTLGECRRQSGRAFRLAWVSSAARSTSCPRGSTWRDRRAYWALARVGQRAAHAPCFPRLLTYLLVMP